MLVKFGNNCCKKNHLTAKSGTFLLSSEFLYLIIFKFVHHVVLSHILITN